MPKRSRKKLAEPEPTPVSVEQSPAGPSPAAKNPAAVALGKLGGAKGGAARAKKLTAQQRSESARKAAQARWNKH